MTLAPALIFLSLTSASAASADPLTYIQVQCHDKKCSEDCDGGPVPQNECIGSTGGGAAMLDCFPTYLQQKLWTNSDCSGAAATTTNLTTFTCQGPSEGLYFENLCCTNNDPRPICTGPLSSKVEYLSAAQGNIVV